MVADCTTSHFLPEVEMNAMGNLPIILLVRDKDRPRRKPEAPNGLPIALSAPCRQTVLSALYRAMGIPLLGATASRLAGQCRSWLARTLLGRAFRAPPPGTVDAWGRSLGITDATVRRCLSEEGALVPARVILSWARAIAAAAALAPADRPVEEALRLLGIRSETTLRRDLRDRLSLRPADLPGWVEREWKALPRRVLDDILGAPQPTLPPPPPHTVPGRTPPGSP